MPSNALTVHFRQVLADAEELNATHFTIRTGMVGQQFGLDALDRSIVVMVVSAWESFLEELLRESLQVWRPAPPFGHWSVLNEFVLGEIARFNTPNTQNITNLFNRCLGLPNISQAWSWFNFTPSQARTELDTALNRRHEIAHGVNPRPVIHNSYSVQLLQFIWMLARCTDAAVRAHLVNVHLVANPWPP